MIYISENFVTTRQHMESVVWLLQSASNVGANGKIYCKQIHVTVTDLLKFLLY